LNRTVRPQPSPDRPDGPAGRREHLTWRGTNPVDGLVDVVVADADPEHRARLAAMLSGASGVQVTGHAGHAAGAFTQALRLRPHIVLLDGSLAGAPDTTRQIVAHLPATRVLALTDPHDRTPVDATLAAGALGYLDKTCTTTELLTIVRAVADAEYWLCPRLPARGAPRTFRFGLAYLSLVA